MNGWDAKAIERVSKPKGAPQEPRTPSRPAPSATQATSGAQGTAEKAVAALAQQERVYYHVHEGSSSLASLRIHHLDGPKLARLVEVLQTELGAWPC